jgi:hypothetical protein
MRSPLVRSPSWLIRIVSGTMRTPVSTIIVMDHADYEEFGDRLSKQRGPSGDDYDIWKKYDSSIRDVMRRHGKTVGWDAGVDFYHGGDWFHELYDGFAVMTTSALTTHLLQDLQRVVAQHHDHAMLSFGGEADTPMRGLDVRITPTTMVAAWYEEDAATCRRKIQQTGVMIL